MNTRNGSTPATTRDAADARFDDTLRRHHAAAVDALSPRARAQLTQRRNAALRGEAAGTRRSHGLRWATAAFAAVFAVALGMQLMSPSVTTGPATPTPTTALATGDAGRVNTVLDEDPEFYAWLASSDGQLLAVE